METESVGSHSTESQTSCQDNDVRMPVICINICLVIGPLIRIVARVA